MWMILASLAAVAVLAAGFAVQQMVSRRRSARDPLPPLCSTDDHVVQPVPAQVLSRDSLVNPNRTLNVHAWDDTPDSGPVTDLNSAFEPDPEPQVLDRDYLINRSRPGAEPR